MSLSVNSSISALYALGNKHAVGANNVANSLSGGFKKSRTILQESEPGGITARTQVVNTPGVIMPQADGTLTEGSNVDLAGEVTASLPIKHAYSANLKALQTIDRMEKTTLDLMG